MPSTPETLLSELIKRDIGGVSSEIAILHSVLGARRRGYELFVLTDCCAGLGQRTEASAFHQMQAAGATLSNLSSFFTGFVPHIDHPAGEVSSRLSRASGAGEQAESVQTLCRVPDRSRARDSR
jgi:Isochorismatase family